MPVINGTLAFGGGPMATLYSFSDGTKRVRVTSLILDQSNVSDGSIDIYIKCGASAVLDYARHYYPPLQPPITATTLGRIVDVLRGKYFETIGAFRIDFGEIATAGDVPYSICYEYPDEMAQSTGTKGTDNIHDDVAALNNLSQADIRTAVGLATANVDTQFTGVSKAAGTKGTDAIYDKVNALPVLASITAWLTTNLRTIMRTLRATKEGDIR